MTLIGCRNDRPCHILGIVMRRFALTIASAAFLLAPAVALAVSVQTYDFKEGSINARWEGLGGITMQQEPTGILLQTGSATGMLLTDTLPPFFPEAATLTVSTTAPTILHFGWIRRNDPSERVFTVELSTSGDAEEPVTFSLRRDPEWKDGLVKFGLVLPPQSAILLNEIAFARWSSFERLDFMARSFWTFDELRPYSINFLWGPLLAMNPVELGGLYDYLPPQQPYAFYWISILVIILIFGFTVFGYARVPAHTRKHWIIQRTFIVLLAAWMLLDARMGGEFLSWVLHDDSTYISAPAEIRTFRDRDRFYDFAAFAAPLVADRETYIFFAQQAWPYMGNIRYLTYPSIPGIDLNYDDTWVVYNRPDLSISNAGQIVMDSEAISFPGTVIGRFDDTSFVFRVTTNQ